MAKAQNKARAMCPFAEKKGLAIYCKVAKKKVSPLTHYCTSDKWPQCEYLRGRICPNVEVKKGEIYCRIIRKKVLTDYCLSENFTECPIYKNPQKYMKEFR